MLNSSIQAQAAALVVLLGLSSILLLSITISAVSGQGWSLPACTYHTQPKPRSAGWSSAVQGSTSSNQQPETWMATPLSTGSHHAAREHQPPENTTEKTI